MFWTAHEATVVAKPATHSKPKGLAMNRLLPLVAAAAAISPLVLVGQSAAASTPKGVIHVYDVNTGGSTGSVVVTGAIGDSGKDITGASPDANQIVLSKGSFDVSTVGIQKSFSKAKPKGSPANCGVVLAASAPATLSDGTGAYEGISGKVVLTITSAAVLPTKADGTCDESPNSVAIGEVTISQGSGTISFK
jgi:hypothetical protein